MHVKIVAIASALKKDHVDEADISSLPHQPARNAFVSSCRLDGQHQLEMPSHIEEPKKCYA